MTYDSPAQTRRRQQIAENKPARRPRQPRKNKTTDWNATCDFHIGRILENVKLGYADAAYRHAAALGHMANRTFNLGVA